MEIKKGKLIGDKNYKVEFVEAKYYTKTQIQRRYLIIHFTAGVSYKRSLETLTNGNKKVSAHLLIGRNGEIAQMVPLHQKAWHVGQSFYKGLTSLNGHTIGIELDNAGPLKKIGHQKWETWYNEHITDESEVYTDNNGKHWHTYTKKQLETLWDVAKTLHETCNFEEVLHHSEVASPRGRKVDAGPAFPMEELRTYLGL